MEYIFIGTIVNTHGIKGEVRIISDFDYKKLAFVKGNKLYIGKRKEEVVINSYRVHKNYDMVTFEGINDINDAIVYKGDDVFINRENLVIDGYLNEDLIGLNVYSNNNVIGSVEAIIKSNAHKIMVIKNNDKKHLIPYVEEFIKNIDLNNGRIDVNAIEGLLNED